MALRRIAGLMLLPYLFPLSLHAQFINDVEARPAVSMEYNVNERLQVGGTYYMYLDRNISRYHQSVFSGVVEYQLRHWIEAGVNYRYGLRSGANFHEFRYSLLFSPNLNTGRWNFSFRSLVQQRNISHQPTAFYLRSLAEAEYDLSENVDLFALTETYLKMSDEYDFDTQKTALGTEIYVSESSALKFQAVMKNKRDYRDYLRFELTYEYTLGQ